MDVHDALGPVSGAERQSAPKVVVQSIYCEIGFPELIMTVPLEPFEMRVLGALIEKEHTTPEYYPMTLKALVAACNQKSNRQPVLQLSENEVLRTLDELRKKRLATRVHMQGNRVPKFEHRLAETFEVDRQETAILMELMLRGPQTLAELKTRGSRIYPFSRMIQVEAAMERLMSRTPQAMAAKLPRQKDQKEPRYAHLLAGEPLIEELPAEPPLIQPTESSDPMGKMELEIQEMRQELAELKQQFQAFKAQFD